MNQKGDDAQMDNGKGISRRELLSAAVKVGVGIAAAGGLGAIVTACGTNKGTTPSVDKPSVNVNTGKTDGQVIVRALGGAYQDAETKAIFTPFTEATGIKVVTVPATAAQVKAMVESGKAQLDVLDLGELTMLSLAKDGALVPIEYDKFKLTDPADIQPQVKRMNMVGNIYFATVLAYNTEVFKPGSQPKSWAEFWDTNKFPGPRTLADQKSGSAELEFASLAEGATMDKLYPLDIDRAFKSLTRVKPSVVKWWDTGAISAELLERKEAVLGGIWNGRVQDLIDKGAPLAIEWSEAKRLLQFWAIVKGAPNKENALKFIDFALQPKVQAELTKYIAYGPTNQKAHAFVRPEDAKKLPSTPEYFNKSFDQDAQWWADNLNKVAEKWNTWALQ